MKLNNGDTLTRRTESHKFHMDGVAEWAWMRCLEGWEYESEGDPDYGWVTLMGRHLLWGYSDGSVLLTRCPSTEEAKQVFAEFHREFDQAMRQEEEGWA
jgi:hypothetical protein